MKKIYTFLLLISGSLMIYLMAGCNQRGPVGTEELHAETGRSLDTLHMLTGEPFLQTIQSGDVSRMREHFRLCRQRYKQLEAALEYFLPGTARGLNGAALPEVEADEHKENEPTGLQVVETFIYPSYDSTNKSELVRAVKNLHAMVYRAQQLWAVTEPTLPQWIDAAYYELVRIATMGITGFDTPGCLTAIAESKTALESVRTIWQALHPEPAQTAHLDAAIASVSATVSFDAFDRAAFLRGSWTTAFKEVAAWRLQQGPVLSRQAIRPEATTLFGNNVLNLDFFLPDSLQSSAAKAQLGGQLFYDTRLSSNGRFSCATCHQPDRFFTDQQTLSENIHGNKLPRNTPSLINAAFQTAYFWDMRVLNLEMQAKAVIDNQNEMHGSLDEVSRLLNTDTLLVQRFRTAYHNDTLHITPALVTSVLASYQRTLVNFDSPFDQYMNGRNDAISADAVAGFNLFMGKAKCATCHFPPTFAGLVPPYFDKMESEVIGVPASASNDKTDADMGRYTIHPVDAFRNAFKTPTVRNAAHTFPYMHNGVYGTLAQVVDFYNKGGGTGLGLDYPNQTLPPDPLNLSEEEQRQLIAFMEALSAPAGVKPSTAITTAR